LWSVIVVVAVCVIVVVFVIVKLVPDIAVPCGVRVAEVAPVIVELLVIYFITSLTTTLVSTFVSVRVTILGNNKCNTKHKDKSAITPTISLVFVFIVLSSQLLSRISA